MLYIRMLCVTAVWCMLAGVCVAYVSKLRKMHALLMSYAYMYIQYCDLASICMYATHRDMCAFVCVQSKCVSHRISVDITTNDARQMWLEITPHTSSPAQYTGHPC